MKSRSSSSEPYARMKETKMTTFYSSARAGLYKPNPTLVPSHRRDSLHCRRHEPGTSLATAAPLLNQHIAHAKYHARSAVNYKSY
ncbi:hypothetical protein PHJA_001236300 [Phtheirospermum japonicum]|uniref:Uncharacterized protein n=1 Tax=Phtheirospermum japonicum TaxID=374723 RepID=A0A830C407_9LAMI|nr:hypothetical protein PHJA_001236300 [Phtheirospermum japonicum]